MRLLKLAATSSALLSLVAASTAQSQQRADLQKPHFLNAIYLQAGAGGSKIVPSEHSDQNYMLVRQRGSSSVGLGIETRPMNRIAIAIEGNLEVRGGRLVEPNGISSQNLRINTSYWQAAGLARFQLGSVGGFQLQPQVGLEYGLQANHHLSDESTGWTLGRVDTRNTVLDGLVGARVRHENMPRFSLDFRYKRGLTETSTDGGFYNRSWLVMASYEFFRR